MRQEASRLGGIGSCGRELCCSTWLTDFKTVSTSAARYQNLSLNTLKLAGQCGKLKCCLNYELDSYMDALKDIPNNIERIETQKGTAWLQKTDIFKKIMWFSYPGEENWIPLSTELVREISQKNKEGIKPEDIGEIQTETKEVKKPVVLDYENVVGQDSLTRLDDKNKRQKQRSKRNKTSGKRQQNTSTQGQDQQASKAGTRAKGRGGRPANKAEGAPPTGEHAAKSPQRRKKRRPEGGKGNRPRPESGSGGDKDA